MRRKELPALMTVADTMAYLQCSKQHVYDLINGGRIKTYKVAGRRYVDPIHLLTRFGDFLRRLVGFSGWLAVFSVSAIAFSSSFSVGSCGMRCESTRLAMSVNRSSSPAI